MIYWSNKEPQIIRRLLPFSPRPKDQYSYRANIFYLALCNVTEKKNKYTAPWRATWLAAPHPHQQPLHRHHCQAAGAEIQRSTLHQRIHSAALLIQHPRENRSDLPSSHSLAIPSGCQESGSSSPARFLPLHPRRDGALGAEGL